MPQYLGRKKFVDFFFRTWTGSPYINGFRVSIYSTNSFTPLKIFPYFINDLLIFASPGRGPAPMLAFFLLVVVGFVDVLENFRENFVFFANFRENFMHKAAISLSLKFRDQVTFQSSRLTTVRIQII
jgi:hypothetical protein